LKAQSYIPTMLYLHCGWDRTGTSSLQRALFENRSRLAAVNIFYPEQWLRSKESPTHHGLHELLDASLSSEHALAEFQAFLSTHRETTDILFSAEALTNWLLSAEKQDAFLRLLAAAQKVMPTRCVWALRRFDEVVSSLYLFGLSLGLAAQLGPPAELFNEGRDPDQLFAGMRRVEEAVEGNVVYVKYDPDGTHNAEILRAMGIAAPIATQIYAELDDGPRRNVSPSHKQAVVLANREALSAKLGLEVNMAALRKAFRRGDISFERDRRCELVGEEVRRNLHSRALEAANAHGITRYTEFFEDAEVRVVPPFGLDLEILTEEDLRRLASAQKHAVEGFPGVGELAPSDQR
jgi:hypothetical protein